MRVIKKLMIVIILDDNNNGIESSGDNIKIW